MNGMKNIYMSDDEYADTQNQLIMLAGLAQTIDVAGFLKRIAKAEALGPITDPFPFRKGQDALESLRNLANEAKKLKDEADRQLVKHRQGLIKVVQ